MHFTSQTRTSNAINLPLDQGNKEAVMDCRNRALTKCSRCRIGINGLLLFGAILAQSLFYCNFSEAQNYTWDQSKGGFVDNQTGLVWGVPAGNVFGAGTDYYGAKDVAPSSYAATAYGFGFKDWYLPTKSQLTDAYAKGLGPLLNAKCAELFNGNGTEDYLASPFWASDAPIKIRGILYGYVVNLGAGYTNQYRVYNATDVILVRGVLPPPPPPSKGK